MLPEDDKAINDIKKQHAEIVKKIDDFIAENKDLNFRTNSAKLTSFGSLVKEYEQNRSKKSTVSKNNKEWHREDKTLENFKKYRKRPSENSIAQLTDFYNFLLSFKGDIIPPSKRIPKEKHPLGSETLVSFLRKKSAMIQIPKDLSEDDS
ncbi:hypothetical protein [Fibrobacter sp. UWB10]|uniref:hypothetical protein n=1 Tax=Fibrobacter sp. UWB10 TaxID=1896201 RepID=UPI0024037353|nr:hypothetical protein [Fibrobacter sp. UWB10]SMP57679.1 hypothetical protein SAMN05720465_2722 [Fibrobacter sp. UWB10]